MSSATEGGEGHPLLRMIQTLAPAVAYKESNLVTNKKVWDLYAKDWKPDQGWVKKMADNLGTEWQEQDLAILGDEWSDRKSLQEILDAWILPNVPEGAMAGEVGVGGGRVAARVAGRCGEFHCFDISGEMLKRARAAVGEATAGAATRVSYHQLEENRLPNDLGDRFDFIYSFDCLPHCDAHTIFAYLKEFRRVLKPGCTALVHTSNITAPGGFARFQKQKEASVQGFCWVSPDIVRVLVQQAGLEMVRESAVSDSNVYYYRDFLCLVRRPAA